MGRNKLKRILSTSIILILLIIFVIGFLKIKENFINSKAILEEKIQLEYEGWLVDNCECIERERLRCLEGWELDGNKCKDGNKFTNVLKSCSLYNCSGDIHELK